jgi:tripartite-type tricarboxylate transporter receptor subunit TctC
MIYTSHTTNASLQKLPYDPIADFAPITMVTSAPLVLIVPAASNMHTVKDLIAAGKAQPLSYGSAGVGSGGHLAGELFRTTTGINATHVPYKGAAPASIDVAGGQLAFQFASQITIQPLVAGKRVRMLAVTSAKRAASLSEVPSLAESGLAGGRSAELVRRRRARAHAARHRVPAQRGDRQIAAITRRAREADERRLGDRRQLAAGIHDVSQARHRALGASHQSQRRETLAAPRAGTADARN